MIRDLNVTATIQRQVTAKRPSITFTEPNKNLMVKLDPPASSKPQTDRSPRGQAPYMLYFRSGLLGVGDALLAGSRVSVMRRLGDIHGWESLLYEALSDARVLRLGGRSQSGWQLPVLPFEELYPFNGAAQTQQGSALGVVRFSLWTDTEIENDHGTYEDFLGEAPIEDLEVLCQQNVKLIVGEDVYRVRTAQADLEGPRVRFTARRANG